MILERNRLTTCKPTVLLRSGARRTAVLHLAGIMTLPWQQKGLRQAPSALGFPSFLGAWFPEPILLQILRWHRLGYRFDH